MDPEMYPAFFNIGVEGKHYSINGDGYLEATQKAANSGYSPKYSFLYDSFIGDFDLKFKLSEDLEASLPAQQEMIEKALEVKGPAFLPEFLLSVGEVCALWGSFSQWKTAL